MWIILIVLFPLLIWQELQIYRKCFKDNRESPYTPDPISPAFKFLQGTFVKLMSPYQHTIIN